MTDMETKIPALSAAPDRWLAYGDAMRVLGVLAVLLVHTCDMVVFSDKTGNRDWWIADCIDAAGRWAVPVFIMLSGALLLDSSRKEGTLEFYRRRLVRLGIAILFWSAFFMLFSVYYTKWRVWDWSSPWSVWRELLYGAPYMHMHFVFRLAGLYAVTPMLRVYVRNAPLRLRVFVVVLLLVVGIADSTASAFLECKSSGFSIFWSFLALYLAGNVLREVKVGRTLAAASWCVAIVSAAAMAVGTGLIVQPGRVPQPFPSTDMMLYDFLSPPRLLLSISAWFIFAHAFGRLAKQSPLQKILGFLAPLTLGIYLVHPLFREIIFKEITGPGAIYGGYAFTWPNVWLGILIVFAIISAASTLLTFILSRVPLVRKIVG
ncbi:MAG: acyltransferase family protein [Planctomycetes bacterium]|nr:acyltransferase family protein [Planctomycetota bacterium]